MVQLNPRGKTAECACGVGVRLNGNMTTAFVTAVIMKVFLESQGDVVISTAKYDEGNIVQSAIDQPRECITLLENHINKQK